MSYTIEPISEREQALRVVAQFEGGMREQDVLVLAYECTEDLFFLHEGAYLPQPGHLETRVHIVEAQSFPDGSIVRLYQLFVESVKSRLDGLSHMHEFHTASCYAELRAQLTERCRWRNAHPFHCRICCGYGVLREPASYDTPGYEGSCPCTEEGLCPLCGSETLNDDLTNCATCNWTYGVTPGEPGVSECDGDYCHYVEHAKQQSV